MKKLIIALLIADLVSVILGTIFGHSGFFPVLLTSPLWVWRVPQFWLFFVVVYGSLVFIPKIYIWSKK